MPDPEMIALKTNDDKTYHVEKEIFSSSNLIKGLLEDCDDGSPIPLTRVDGHNLEKIIAWCTLHRNDPPYIEQTKVLPDETDMEKEMFKTDQTVEKLETDEPITQLMNAANYMDIPILVKMIGKHIANLMIEMEWDSRKIKSYMAYSNNSEDMEEGNKYAQEGV